MLSYSHRNYYNARYGTYIFYNSDFTLNTVTFQSSGRNSHLPILSIPYNPFFTQFFLAKQLLFISLTSSTFNSEVRRYLLLENAHQKFLTETIAYMEENVLDVDPFYLWG